jgi:4-carboxymuconolactone decarboxylase
MREHTTSERPRVPPLSPSELDSEAEELLAKTGKGDSNMFKTLLRHPRLVKRWLPFGHAILNGALPVRDRELLVLRATYRARCEYMSAHHERIALDVGMDHAEIMRVQEGPEASGWSAFDAALLRAVDELCDDYRICDVTWQALAEQYDDRQLVEVPMLVGHFIMLAQASNSFGVEVEPGF